MNRSELEGLADFGVGEAIECIDETNAGTQVTILSAIELVLSGIQLVISLISLILVTHIKPWKKFKVKI